MYRLAPPMAHGAGIVGRLCAGCLKPTVANRPSFRPAAPFGEPSRGCRRDDPSQHPGERPEEACGDGSKWPLPPSILCSGDGSSRHCPKEPTFVWQNDEGCHGISPIIMPPHSYLAIGLTNLTVAYGPV